MTQSRRKRCSKMTAVPAGAGVTPGSGADERRGCTPPACLHADKTWYGRPKGSSKYHPRAADRHLRTVPTFAETTAARTNAGQAGETAIARRSAKRKHKNTQRHPLTQGADADSAVHHPAADICRVNSSSARTYPKSKTRFALTNDIYSFAAPDGGAAREALRIRTSQIGRSPCLCRSSRKRPPTKIYLLVGGRFLRDPFTTLRRILRRPPASSLAFGRPPPKLIVDRCVRASNPCGYGAKRESFAMKRLYLPPFVKGKVLSRFTNSLRCSRMSVIHSDCSFADVL